MEEAGLGMQPCVRAWADREAQALDDNSFQRRQCTGRAPSLVCGGQVSPMRPAM